MKQKSLCQESAVYNSEIIKNNKSYIFSIIIIVVSTFLVMLSNTKFQEFKNIGSVGFANLFVFCLIKNSIIEVFAPIIPNIAIIELIISEKFRSKKRIKRIISVALRGGSSFIVASIIVLLIFIILSPTVGETLFSINGILPELYVSSKIGYIFFYIFHSLIFGSIFSLFGYSIFICSHNRFHVLVFAMLIYRISTFIPNIQNVTITNYLNVVLPFFPYEITGFSDSLYTNIWQLVLILVVSLMLIYFNKEKRRLKNEMEET